MAAIIAVAAREVGIGRFGPPVTITEIDLPGNVVEIECR